MAALEAFLEERQSQSPLGSRWMPIAASPVAKLARKWIRSGELPSCRPGRIRLVDRAVHDVLCEQYSRVAPTRLTKTASGEEEDVDAELLRGLGLRRRAR